MPTGSQPRLEPPCSPRLLSSSLRLLGACLLRLTVHSAAQAPVYGASNGTFDEEGYLHVPPCVFGTAEEGLNPPPVLAFNTTLVSTKRCRANYGHHGEMSLWQTYGAWA